MVNWDSKRWKRVLDKFWLIIHLLAHLLLGRSLLVVLYLKAEISEGIQKKRRKNEEKRKKGVYKRNHSGRKKFYRPLRAPLIQSKEKYK